LMHGTERTMLTYLDPHIRFTGEGLYFHNSINFHYF
jgi:hypothetical protein